MKTIPHIQMFLNQIYMVKMKNESQKSRKLEVFHPMTRTLILTHFLLRWKKLWRQYLSLSLEMENNFLEKLWEP